MAVSRPILLALGGAIVTLVAFYAMSGSREPEPSDPARSAAERSTAPKGASKLSATAGETGGRSGVGSVRRATPKAAHRREPVRRAGMPAGLRTALAGKRTVVLFFFQRGSADDDATARSVSSLRGRRGVKVFSAPISRLGDYHAVIGAAGVSQAPAIVIISPDRGARLIEGFVDRETLAQQVADAR